LNVSVFHTLNFGWSSVLSAAMKAAGVGRLSAAEVLQGLKACSTLGQMMSHRFDSTHGDYLISRNRPVLTS